MTTQTLTIPIPSEAPVMVDAEVFGPLAVHPSIGGGGWTITHIETGLALLSGICDYEDTVKLTQYLLTLSTFQDVQPGTYIPEQNAHRGSQCENAEAVKDALRAFIKGNLPFQKNFRRRN